jgi:hypothetical protein
VKPPASTPPRIAFPLLAAALLGGLLSPALCAAPAAVMPPTAPAERHLRITRTHRFTVSLPLAGAFTLFEPVGEKCWAEGWSPVFPTPGDAELSDNTVFTRTLSHDGRPETSIWLITRYDPPAGVIEYRAIVPGVRVSRITVRCRPVGESQTSVEVTYRHTSLSEEGDRYVERMTGEHYRAFIEEWASAIRAYLARGTPATP